MARRRYAHRQRRRARGGAEEHEGEGAVCGQRLPELPRLAGTRGVAAPRHYRGHRNDHSQPRGDGRTRAHRPPPPSGAEGAGASPARRHARNTGRRDDPRARRARRPHAGRFPGAAPDPACRRLRAGPPRTRRASIQDDPSPRGTRRAAPSAADVRGSSRRFRGRGAVPRQRRPVAAHAPPLGVRRQGAGPVRAGGRESVPPRHRTPGRGASSFLAAHRPRPAPPRHRAAHLLGRRYLGGACGSEAEAGRRRARKGAAGTDRKGRRRGSRRDRRAGRVLGAHRRRHPRKPRSRRSR